MSRRAAQLRTKNECTERETGSGSRAALPRGAGRRCGLYHVAVGLVRVAAARKHHLRLPLRACVGVERYRGRAVGLHEAPVGGVLVALEAGPARYQRQRRLLEPAPRPAPPRASRHAARRATGAARRRQPGRRGRVGPAGVKAGGGTKLQYGKR